MFVISAHMLILLDVYLCSKLFSPWFGKDARKRDFKHGNETDCPKNPPETSILEISLCELTKTVDFINFSLERVTITLLSAWYNVGSF